MIQDISSVRKDFLASQLRTQLSRMNTILQNFGDEEKVDCGYMFASLREIETNLRHIRKFCTNN